MNKCKVCGEETPMIVNINFAETPVCNLCCLAITKQTVATLVVNGSHIIDKFYDGDLK